MALHNVVGAPELRGQDWFVQVVYYTDDGTFKQSVDVPITGLSFDQFSQIVRARQDQIQIFNIDLSGLKQITSVQGTEIPPIVIVVPPPNPARDAWFSLVNEMRLLDPLSSTQKTKSDLQTQIDSTFDPSFVGLK